MSRITLKDVNWERIRSTPWLNAQESMAYLGVGDKRFKEYIYPKYCALELPRKVTPGIIKFKKFILDIVMDSFGNKPLFPISESLTSASSACGFGRA